MFVVKKKSADRESVVPGAARDATVDVVLEKRMRRVVRNRKKYKKNKKINILYGV